MAIAYDAHATTSGATDWLTTSNSWTHNVGAGDNNIAVVVLMQGPSATDPDTVTFGGVAMTLLAKYTGVPSSFITYIYYRKNVTIGNNTVAVTFDPVIYYADYGTIFSLTFTGVDQDTPFRAGHGGTADYSTEASLATTTVSGDVVLSLLFNANAYEFTEGAGQTVVHYNARVSDTCNASIKTASGASTTNTWTYSPDMWWSLYGAALIPASSTSDRTISENFTIHASIDAWKTPDTLSENFTIDADMKANFLHEGSISEDFSISAVVSFIRETSRTMTDGVTINAAMEAAMDTIIREGFTISDAISAPGSYGMALASGAGLGASMDATFDWPVKRYKMPYRAQGSRLSIKIMCNEKGAWMKLLDISAKILPIAGRTRSQAVQLKATGNHVTVKIGNTSGATLKLAYVGVQIERNMAR